MNDRKQKIAVIAQNIDQPRSLMMFECLTKRFEVTIFTIESSSLLKSYSSSIPLRIFEHLPDMPGYMRDLEDQINDFDIFIAVESSTLSTFQAIRIAQKSKKPCAIIVNEFHPYFYAKYPNIRAVQVDAFENADGFWATSAGAMAMLQMEGVKSDRIHKIKPMIDVNRFKVSAVKRKKFRDYAKINEEDTVILFYGSLDEASRAEEVLLAFKLLHSTNPSATKNLKLLFAGDGSEAKQIKYKAYDLGLGSHTFFIHHDVDTIIQDIFAASDVLIHPKSKLGPTHEPYPYSILEAMLCGLIPIVNSGTVEAEICKGMGEILDSDGFQNIFKTFEKILSPTFDRNVESQRVVEYVQSAFSHDEIELNLNQLVDQLCKLQKSKKNWETSLPKRIGEIENSLKCHDSPAALVKIEDLLIRDISSIVKRAEVNRLKGDALCQQGNLEDGMAAYSIAIQLDQENFKAYRGLGFIALKSHSHEEALTFFKKALSKEQDDCSSILGIAMIYQRIGLNEEALYWLEKCLEIDIENAQATTSFIQVCMDSPLTKNAIEALERVIDDDCTNSSLMMTLGQLYLKEGRAKDGAILVEKALILQNEISKKVA